MPDGIHYKAFKWSVSAGGDGTTPGWFEGHAAVFDNVDRNGDVIAPGAFTKTLSEHNGVFPLLWQHDLWEPIGATETMGQDAKGLYMAGVFNQDVQRGREALSLMKQGALQGFSIGYWPIKSEPHPDRAGVILIREIKLLEVSTVTIPANPEATLIAAKAARTIADARALLGGDLSAAERKEIEDAIGALDALTTKREPAGATPDRGGAASNTAEWGALAAFIRDATDTLRKGYATS